MNRFLVIVGATAGSWLGWTVGAHVGLGTAFVLSGVGMAAGWIAVIKVRKYYGW